MNCGFEFILAQPAREQYSTVLLMEDVRHMCSVELTLTSAVQLLCAALYQFY
jgi:hypothetical protein